MAKASKDAVTAAAAAAPAFAGKTTIPHAVWPDDAPHAEETVVVTVVASDTHYRWAVHEGHDEEFFPVVFWR